MVEGVAVSRVVIYNRIDCCGLSNSVVSLLNHQGNTLKTYSIGDATNVPIFDMNGLATTASPTASLISTDFSTVPSNSALSGSAFVSNGECVLTPNAIGQSGYLLFDSVALTLLPSMPSGIIGYLMAVGQMGRVSTMDL